MRQAHDGGRYVKGGGMAITQVQVEAAYAVAKREYGKAITSEAAANHLVSKYGWNESSAYGYVHTFLCMMDGKEYQRTINAYATEYYPVSYTHLTLTTI